MKTSFSIQDLCDQTGLPRRTIHFYTQQGLLPPPEGAGLGAHYTETHLLRLRAIPLFRQQGLRLDEIRQKIERMDTNTLRKLVSESSAQLPPQKSIECQTVHQYQFNGGIVIAAPSGLSPSNQRKLDRLLDEAQKIFLGTIHPLEKE